MSKEKLVQPQDLFLVNFPKRNNVAVWLDDSCEGLMLRYYRCSCCGNCLIQREPTPYCSGCGSMMVNMYEAISDYEESESQRLSKPKAEEHEDDVQGD